MIAKVIEPSPAEPVGKGTGLGSAPSTDHQAVGRDAQDRQRGRSGHYDGLWLPSARGRDLAEEAQDVADVGFIKGRESLPTVLLVDDSEELREMTAISLRELDFEVTVAAGGGGALAIVEKEPDKFDIIVTDFADASRFWRRRDPLRSQSALGLASYHRDGICRLEKIVDRSSDASFLTKPFLDFDLAESIRAASDAANKAGRAPRQLVS